MGDEVGSLHAVFPGHSFLGGTREAIEKVTDADGLEPGLLERFDHLCNLQSAGNSPGPEVNVIACGLGQLGADDDIGELQPAAAAKKVMVIGGGEIYRQFLPLAGRIYLTRVQAEIKGDTLFPELEMDDWEVVSVQEYPAAEDREFGFDIETLDRVRPYHGEPSD